MLTVNSPFFFINSLVPSNGSINQYEFQVFLSFHSIRLSSLNIGTFGLKDFNLFKIKLFDFISASVIGELSSFISTLKDFLYTF